MTEEYLDKNGQPMETGFYMSLGNGNLAYIDFEKKELDACEGLQKLPDNFNLFSEGFVPCKPEDYLNDCERRTKFVLSKIEELANSKS